MQCTTPIINVCSKSQHEYAIVRILTFDFLSTISLLRLEIPSNLHQAQQRSEIHLQKGQIKATGLRGGSQDPKSVYFYIFSPRRPLKHKHSIYHSKPRPHFITSFNHHCSRSSSRHHLWESAYHRQGSWTQNGRASERQTDSCPYHQGIWTSYHRCGCGYDWVYISCDGHVNVSESDPDPGHGS